MPRAGITQPFFNVPETGGGTLALFAPASESPIAIACCSPGTFFPLLPLVRFPFLNFCIASLTVSRAFFPYLRISPTPYWNERLVTDI